MFKGWADVPIKTFVINCDGQLCASASTQKNCLESISLCFLTGRSLVSLCICVMSLILRHPVVVLMPLFCYTCKRCQLV